MTYPRPTRRTERGFTLLEVIVVMMILAVLFGIGVGAFRKLARPEQLALSQIKQALRSARLFARSQGAPASVALLPAEDSVRAFGMAAVGNWHFEDDEGTGWPMAAVYEPGSLTPAGVIGSALQLGSGTPLSLPSPPPSFDSPNGFGVDGYFQPAPEPRPMTLLERPGLWSIRLNEDGWLEVLLHLAEGGGVQDLPVAFEGESLSAAGFTRVTVLFDGRSLEVSVNGLRVGQDLVFEQPRRLARNPGVSIGTGQAPSAFRGALDELRLLSVVVTEDEVLPSEVSLRGASRMIRLDAQGHLDPTWHRTPVTIVIEHGDPPRESAVRVGLLGTLRTLELLVGAPPLGLPSDEVPADPEASR